MMNEQVYHQNICTLIKLLRQQQRLKQEYVARKAGYANRSVYTKLETGKIKALTIGKFQSICDALSCKSHHVMLLARIENFNYNINTWEEFITSLHHLDPQDRAKKLELAQTIIEEVMEAERAKLVVVS
jgi:transcriptional regulator with XRE-family HTH domain